MYTVIFVDTKGPAKLGQFEDKGACRRAWKMLNAGAAILDASGAVLEHRGGITDAAKRKLDAYAEHLRRQGGLVPAAPAPAPARAKVTVERVEEEDEDAEREPAPVAAPPPAATPAPEPRPAEVTHAIHPTTGAVVQGDDTERLTPAERRREPGDDDEIDSFTRDVAAIELPGEAVGVWLKHRGDLTNASVAEREAAWKALCKRTGDVGKMANPKVWLKKAIAEEDARRAAAEGRSSDAAA